MSANGDMVQLPKKEVVQKFIIPVEMNSKSTIDQQIYSYLKQKHENAFMYADTFERNMTVFSRVVYTIMLILAFILRVKSK
jgi:hypothetical protein